MESSFTAGQSVRHRDLNIIGIVESYIPIRVHVANSPVREMLNVTVGDTDNIWWDTAKIIPVDMPVAPTPEVLTIPTLESVPTLVTI